MEKFIKYAFRITHIDNISHIAKYGLVRDNSPLRNEQYVSIGDPQIIHIRKDLVIQGFRIGDYIPFYFGPRSPMLYVIQHGYNGVKQVPPEKIVYCVIRLKDIVDNDVDCIFTNGHALSVLTSFFLKSNLPFVNKYVKYNDVYSTRWDSDIDIDLKRRKEAELLVKTDLASSFICGYVVYCEGAKARLIELGIDDSLIVVVPHYYF